MPTTIYENSQQIGELAAGRSSQGEMNRPLLVSNAINLIVSTEKERGTEIPTIIYSGCTACCGGVDCVNCPDTAASQYVISGITGVTCPCGDTSLLNTDHILDATEGGGGGGGSICDWEKNFTICGLPARVSANRGTDRWSATVYIEADGATITYESAILDPSTSCLTTTTLSLVSSSGGCISWPSSITIAPA